MDLSKRVARARWVTLVDPADEKTPCGLKVLLRPRSSEEVKAVGDQLREEKLALAERDDLSDKEKASLGQKLDDDYGHKILVAAIADWEWGNDPDGEPLTWNGSVPDCTPENVSDLFKTLEWVTEQVLAAFRKKSAFFGN